MTKFYLASVEEPGMMRRIAERAGAVFIDKLKPNGLYDLGRQHHDAYSWVIDNEPEMGELAVSEMKRGARAAGTQKPRVEYFQNPNDALKRFSGSPGQRPDVVITDYRMNEYGINGFEVINRMRELEKGV